MSSERRVCMTGLEVCNFHIEWQEIGICLCRQLSASGCGLIYPSDIFRGWNAFFAPSQGVEEILTFRCCCRFYRYSEIAVEQLRSST